MPWEYSEAYYREYTRSTWNESAEAYTKLLENLEPFRADLVERLRVHSGEKIVDLGTGPGEPALSIAGQLGSQGEVFGVDLSENMISIARRVASARSVKNAEFRVMDCSSLEFGDARFDGAISSFGFQIFTDPEKASKEAFRVLRPNGRIAVSVWSTGERVPWIHAIVGPMLKHAEPDETGYIPTPYELGAPGEMTTLLETAGFRNAREDRRTHLLRWADEEQYLESLLKATPIGHSLSEETPEVQQEVLHDTRSNLKQWKTESGLAIPGECVFVTADKPG